MINEDNNIKRKQKLVIVLLIVVVLAIIGTTYAFFNYTREGQENVINTGVILFDFQDSGELQLSNQFPISESDLTNDYKIDFSISGHNTLTDGVDFNVYAVHGDDVTGKTWLTDNIIKMKLVSPSNGDGFTITNNYATAASPIYTDGKALLATGNIKNTSALTTKNFTLYVWIDDSLAFVSSTTKRANNAEGNPSLADATSGTTTATRYMKNNNVASTVTLYPADADSQGKIIYTTNEFSNSHYSVRIRVESTEA